MSDFDLVESTCCGRLMPAHRVNPDGVCDDCAAWWAGEEQ